MSELGLVKKEKEYQKLWRHTLDKMGQRENVNTFLGILIRTPTGGDSTAICSSACFGRYHFSSIACLTELLNVGCPPSFRTAASLFSAPE